MRRRGDRPPHQGLLGGFLFLQLRKSWRRDEVSGCRPLIWGVPMDLFQEGAHPPRASPTLSPLPPAGVGLNPELAKLKGKLANF